MIFILIKMENVQKVINTKDTIIDIIYVVLVVATVIFCIRYSINRTIVKDNFTGGETRIEAPKENCGCKCCGK